MVCAKVKTKLNWKVATSAQTVRFFAKSAPTPTPTPTPNYLGSLSSLALSASCKNYKQSSEFAPYVLEWGVCQFQNTDVQAYRFAKAGDLESFLKTVTGFGIVRETLAIRGLFMFAPNDATKLKSLRIALGL